MNIQHRNQFNGRISAAVLVGTMLTLLMPVSSLAATFQGLGFLNNGAPGSFAYGVSADGSAVVGYSYGVIIGIQYDQGVEWKNGTAIQLKNYADGGYLTNTDGAAISGDGSTIVGQGYLNPSSPTSTLQGLVLRSGVLTPITPLPGYMPYYVYPTAASGDGSVVAGYDFSSTPPNVREAFVWQNGATIGLSSLPGAPNALSVAYGISADGSVIVGGGTNAMGNGQAVRWVADAMGGFTATPLPFPPGHNDDVARAVSADGLVAVGSGESGVGPQTSLMWKNGTATDLGLPAGADGGRANGVSGDGSVVVGFNNFPGGTRSQQGYTWTQQTGMLDLQSYLLCRNAAMLA